MIRATQDHGQTVRIPTNKLEAAARIRMTMRMLSAESGQYPTMQKIAQQMELPLQRLETIFGKPKS
ncbi:hypothetical protein [Desulfosarcina sp.]|uniref:hypothetical protein n=1 Tax=Desulfosarcina sp. TaxID=2027861 RepID=UPI0029ACF42E|nr:hypothetical protein [Desulfosarcina sp.]MDX2451410.1 hypothetical protein [Desulfosarcina sp.]MDX2489231.1 hypothetical protein [Desulfosarcina sp.]